MELTQDSLHQASKDMTSGPEAQATNFNLLADSIFVRDVGSKLDISTEPSKEEHSESMNVAKFLTKSVNAKPVTVNCSQTNDRVFTKEYIREKERQLRKISSPDQAAKALDDKLKHVMNRNGLYKEGMTLADLVKSKESQARQNIDQFVVDNALRLHIENTYLPLERKFAGLHEQIKVLNHSVADDHKSLVDTQDTVTYLKELAMQVGELRKNNWIFKDQIEGFKNVIDAQKCVADTRFEQIAPEVKDLQAKVAAMELKMAQPDGKMELFWKHLSTSKDTFEDQFTAHQQRIEDVLKQYKHQIDKCRYTTDSVSYQHNKIEGNINDLYARLSATGLKIDTEVFKKIELQFQRMIKLEMWKQECVNHFEQTLPFQIACIGYELGSQILKKKKEKVKYAVCFDALLQKLTMNRKMVNIQGYSQIATQGIGCGIRGGTIYDCPYKMGVYSVPEKYKQYTDPHYRKKGKRRGSHSSKYSSKLSAAVPAKGNKRNRGNKNTEPSEEGDATEKAAKGLGVARHKESSSLKTAQTMRPNLQAQKAANREGLTNAIQKVRTEIADGRQNADAESVPDAEGLPKVEIDLAGASQPKRQTREEWTPQAELEDHTQVDKDRKTTGNKRIISPDPSSAYEGGGGASTANGKKPDSRSEPPPVIRLQNQNAQFRQNHDKNNQQMQGNIEEIDPSLNQSIDQQSLQRIQQAESENKSPKRHSISFDDTVTLLGPGPADMIVQRPQAHLPPVDQTQEDDFTGEAVQAANDAANAPIQQQEAQQQMSVQKQVTITSDMTNQDANHQKQQAQIKQIPSGGKRTPSAQQRQTASQEMLAQAVQAVDSIQHSVEEELTGENASYIHQEPLLHPNDGVQNNEQQSSNSQRAVVNNSSKKPADRNCPPPSKMPSSQAPKAQHTQPEDSISDPFNSNDETIGKQDAVNKKIERPSPAEVTGKGLRRKPTLKWNGSSSASGESYSEISSPKANRMRYKAANRQLTMVKLDAEGSPVKKQLAAPSGSNEAAPQMAAPVKRRAAQEGDGSQKAGSSGRKTSDHANEVENAARGQRRSKTSDRKKQQSEQEAAASPKDEKSPTRPNLPGRKGELDIIPDRADEDLSTSSAGSDDSDSEESIDNNVLERFRELQDTLNGQDDLLDQLKDEINEVRTMHVSFEEVTNFQSRERKLKLEEQLSELYKRVGADIARSVEKSNREHNTVSIAIKKDIPMQIAAAIHKKSIEDDRRFKSMAESFDAKLKSLKDWIEKMNQVVSLTSLLDQQDEIDRSSLSLVGLKPKEGLESHRSQQTTQSRGIPAQPSRPMNNQNQGGLERQEEQQTIRLDPQCLNCASTGNTEKKMLFEKFKLACLQYRPSAIQLDAEGKVTLPRREILQSRALIIDMMRDQYKKAAIQLDEGAMEMVSDYNQKTTQNADEFGQQHFVHPLVVQQQSEPSSFLNNTHRLCIPHALGQPIQINNKQSTRTKAESDTKGLNLAFKSKHQVFQTVGPTASENPLPSFSNHGIRGLNDMTNSHQGLTGPESERKESRNIWSPARYNMIALQSSGLLDQNINIKHQTFRTQGEDLVNIGDAGPLIHNKQIFISNSGGLTQRLQHAAQRNASTVLGSGLATSATKTDYDASLDKLLQSYDGPTNIQIKGSSMRRIKNLPVGKSLHIGQNSEISRAANQYLTTLPSPKGHHVAQMLSARVASSGTPTGGDPRQQQHMTARNHRAIFNNTAVHVTTRNSMILGPLGKEMGKSARKPK